MRIENQKLAYIISLPFLLCKLLKKLAKRRGMTLGDLSLIAISSSQVALKGISSVLQLQKL